MRGMRSDEVDEYVRINHELVQHFAALLKVFVDTGTSQEACRVLVIAIKEVNIIVYFWVNVIVVEKIIK